jgi:phosphate/sulfate permease
VDINKPESMSEQAVVTKTSGLAIASLVLGICGFVACGITSIVGLILGIVGVGSIRKSAGQLKGEGLAIAGIVVSAISLILVPVMCIMMAILMPALVRARSHARTAASLNNVKQACLAVILYCDEHDGKFPPADNWPDVLEPYLGRDEKILSSPFDPDAGRAYAINAHLNGRQRSDIDQPHRTVLVFEARFGSPPSGGRELLPEKPRGRTGYVIGFLDGHLECVLPERLDELVWEP